MQRSDGGKEVRLYTIHTCKTPRRPEGGILRAYICVGVKQNRKESDFRKQIKGKVLTGKVTQFSLRFPTSFFFVKV